MRGVNRASGAVPENGLLVEAVVAPGDVRNESTAGQSNLPPFTPIPLRNVTLFGRLPRTSAIVAGGVKRADLTGEVALETTDPGEQTGEREQKRDVERHQKMTGGHE